MLTVTGSVPFITSANNTSFTAGTLSTFTVTATGNPAPTFSYNGAFPSGVTLSANGVWTGTPSTVGTFPITITASNGVTPNATQSFTLTVTGTPPAFTSANQVTIVEGTAGTFAVTASGIPTPTFSLSAGTLPTGVSFNLSTGVVSWLSSLSAPLGVQPSVTFTATNSVNSASQIFTITVDKVPAITSAASVSYVHGIGGTFTVTTTGYPAAALTATALPTGVTFTDNGNGTGSLVVGPTAAVGGENITITATNTINSVLRTATQNFTLTVTNPELLAGPANTNPKAQPLTQKQLAPIVSAAIQLWVKAGITPIQAALLRSTSITIGNLSSLDELADTANGKIVLDATADGDGWYIDPHPLSNIGFTAVPGTSQLIAKSGSASKEVDLLTVVLHEDGTYSRIARPGSGTLPR